MLRLSGSSALSPFRRDRLLARLPRVRALSAEFQHFVSRMECAYVFEEVIHAVEHAATGKGLVYEVEFVDPAAKQSQHCMNLVKNAVPPHLLIPRMEENARAYWTSASIQKAEILTLSGLRVVRRVS